MWALVRWEYVECEKSTLLDFFKSGVTATHFSANERLGVQLSESQIGSWIRRCGEERRSVEVGCGHMREISGKRIASLTADRVGGVVVVVVRGIIGVGDRAVRSSDSVGGGE